MKVAGHWTYLYRAVDQYGQVIDVLLSARRDLAAARRFFTRALRAGTVPAEVTTDRAPVYPRVLDELVPSALHTVEQYANNPIESDHGRLKARLRPMRGLKRHRSARHPCRQTCLRRSCVPRGPPGVAGQAGQACLLGRATAFRRRRHSRRQAAGPAIPRRTWIHLGRVPYHRVGRGRTRARRWPRVRCGADRRGRSPRTPVSTRPGRPCGPR